MAVRRASIAVVLWLCHGYAGALLYELAAGVPPFGGGAAPPTVGARAVPPQLLLPLVPVARCSAELHDLLDALLDKQAGLRPTWAQLREHPFWKVRVEAEPIPPQPAYEAWLQAHPTSSSSPIAAAAAAAAAATPAASTPGTATTADEGWCGNAGASGTPLARTAPTPARAARIAAREARRGTPARPATAGGAGSAAVAQRCRGAAVQNGACTTPAPPPAVPAAAAAATVEHAHTHAHAEEAATAAAARGGAPEAAVPRRGPPTPSSSDALTRAHGGGGRRVGIGGGGGGGGGGECSGEGDEGGGDVSGSAAVSAASAPLSPSFLPRALNETFAALDETSPAAAAVVASAAATAGASDAASDAATRAADDAAADGAAAAAAAAAVATAAAAVAAADAASAAAQPATMEAIGRCALHPRETAPKPLSHTVAASVIYGYRLVFHPHEIALKPLVHNAAIERPEPLGNYEARALLRPAALPALPALPTLVALPALPTFHSATLRPCPQPHPPLSPTPPPLQARALPFKPHTAAELLALPPPQLEAFLGVLYKSVGGTTAAAEKCNTLLFIESLAPEPRLAATLLNSSFTPLWLSLLRTASLASLRLRLVSVLALLLRHTTFVGADLARGELLRGLTDALKDRSEKVRRRVMAALGELLFYIAVRQQQARRPQQQQQQQEHDGAPEAAAAAAAAAAADDDDSGWGSPWAVPRETVAALTSRLGGAEDAVVRHYALKAVENVLLGAAEATEGGLPAAFAQQAVLADALHLAAGGTPTGSTPPSEAVRITAAGMCAQLLRLRPGLSVAVLQEGRLAAILSSVRDGTPRLAQALGSVLVVALCDVAARRELRAAPPLAQQRALLRAATSLLGRPQPLLRAKGCLAAALLGSLGLPWLHQAAELKLLPALASAAAAADAGVRVEGGGQQAWAFLQQVVYAVVPCLAALRVPLLRAAAAAAAAAAPLPPTVAASNSSSALTTASAIADANADCDTASASSLSTALLPESIAPSASASASPSPSPVAPLSTLRLLRALCTCAPLRVSCADGVLLHGCVALLHKCAPAAARGEPGGERCAALLLELLDLALQAGVEGCGEGVGGSDGGRGGEGGSECSLGCEGSGESSECGGGGAAGRIPRNAAPLAPPAGMLPPLCALLGAPDGALRCSAWRHVHALLACGDTGLLLDQLSLSPPRGGAGGSGGSGAEAEAEQLAAVVRAHLLPQYTSLLRLRPQQQPQQAAAPAAAAEVHMGLLLLARLLGSGLPGILDACDELGLLPLLPPLLLASTERAEPAQPYTLPLLRSICARPAALLPAGLAPLLLQQLQRLPPAEPAAAEPLLEALYLVLYFVRSATQHARAQSHPPSELGGSTSAAGDGDVGGDVGDGADDSGDGVGGGDGGDAELLTHVTPLLATVPLLLPMLLAPEARLADKVGRARAPTAEPSPPAPPHHHHHHTHIHTHTPLHTNRHHRHQASHVLALLAQLLGGAAPRRACRALLSGDAPAALLLVLAARDREPVRRRALGALRWLQLGDRVEFHAALAASPELQAVFQRECSARS